MTDKRLNRSTGNYDTLNDLTAAVMKLHTGKHHSRDVIGVLVGVSAATVSRIINDNTVREVNVDLNAIFNNLWVMTEKFDEQP